MIAYRSESFPRLMGRPQHPGQQFDQLLSVYEGRIYNVAYRMLNDPDDAADVTQDTFFRAYRSFAGFRGHSRPYTWLYRIAVNCCKDRLLARERQRNHELHSVDDVTDEEIVEQSSLCSIEESPERVLLRHELQDVVRAAIQALPARYRAVIILRELQNLSYNEISSVLGAPLETVKSRIFRARGALRVALAEYVVGTSEKAPVRNRRKTASQPVESSVAH